MAFPSGCRDEVTHELASRFLRRRDSEVSFNSHNFSLLVLKECHRCPASDRSLYQESLVGQT